MNRHQNLHETSVAQYASGREMLGKKQYNHQHLIVLSTPTAALVLSTYVRPDNEQISLLAENRKHNVL